MMLRYICVPIYIDEVIKFYWFKLGTRMGSLDRWIGISLTAQIWLIIGRLGYYFYWMIYFIED